MRFVVVLILLNISFIVYFSNNGDNHRDLATEESVEIDLLKEDTLLI